MATIRKRGGKWYAEIRKKGHTKRATFRTKGEATAWAVDTERAIEAGNTVPNRPFSDLLDRYEREVSKHKRGYRWESARIGLFKRDPIASILLPKLSQPDVVDWRNRRIRQVSAGSVRREWSLMTHACNVAMKEWHWLTANPFTGVKRPESPPPRVRRISEEEITRILLAAGYEEPPQTMTARVACAFLFAIETAMRASEIASISPENTHGRYVHLSRTKNGNARDVPLSQEAQRVLALVNGDFRLSAEQISTLFRKIKHRAMLPDLHFHDTRREALTRLSKKLDALELARVSGHRDLRVLLSVYYRPEIDDLADKLD